MNEESNQIEIAALGREADTFKASRLGRYLVQKAVSTSDEAVEALVKCGPSDLKSNTDLRNTIQVSQMFINWMDEAITEGVIAEECLIDER